MDHAVEKSQHQKNPRHPDHHDEEGLLNFRPALHPVPQLLKHAVPHFASNGTRARTIPPAMIDPTCPDTLAPTACIRMKVKGSSSWAILWITRADMGKADIPQAPIIGLILRFRKRFSILANSTPAAVSKTKGTRPL